MRRLVVLVLSLAATSALATPVVVTQQGRLLDGSDQPVTGTHTLAFSLYRHLVHDPSTPDPALWTGTYPVTFDDHGLYAVGLGDPDVSGNAPLDSSAFVDADPGAGRYLEIAVDGTTLSPRLAIGTVPFAMVATALDGGPVDATKIAIAGRDVVDASGDWVGGTTTLDGRYVQTSDLTSGEVPVPWTALTGVPTLVKAGDGLSLGDDGALAFNAGAGLAIDGGAVKVETGDGLAIDGDGKVTVATGSGLVIQNGQVAVDFGQANLDAKYLRLDGANSMTGALSGTSATFSGALGAQSLTTSGAMTAASVTTSGAVSAQSLTTTGAITSQSLTTGDVDAASVTASGDVKAASLTSTGALTAASVTTTGALDTASLKTTGDATVGGNLAVAGTVSVRPAHQSIDTYQCQSADEGTLFFDPTAKVFFGCARGKVVRISPEPGDSAANAGASCKDVLASGGSHGNGLYWIDPAGAAGQGTNPLLAYCDMTTDGGGWTLMLHTTYTGSYPSTGALQETFADWKTKGVGAVTDYGGSIATSGIYVMPLETFRLLAQASTALRFESDHLPVHSELDGLTVASNYAINGSNRSQVAIELCGSGASTNCFLRDNGSGPPGFSSYDVHNDHSNGSCNYNNVGWWYDDCYTYNAFRTDDASFYSNSQKDSSTRHWSWWVR